MLFAFFSITLLHGHFRSVGQNDFGPRPCAVLNKGGEKNIRPFFNEPSRNFHEASQNFYEASRSFNKA